MSSSREIDNHERLLREQHNTRNEHAKQRSQRSSAVPSVQKWVIEKDIEKQLRSYSLQDRLRVPILPHGPIELYLVCLNLTAIGWGEPSEDTRPLSANNSLLRVDLSGCPKLKYIPSFTFNNSPFIEEVFSPNDNLSTIGASAFQECFGLKSITLPTKIKRVEMSTFANCSALERVVFNKKLKTIAGRAFQNSSTPKSIVLYNKLQIIEWSAFMKCTSLERVVCGKNLKTIGRGAFYGCSKLEDFQLASSSISFGDWPFVGCDRLIELAAAAGFPSNTFSPETRTNEGVGVVPYLIAQCETSERRDIVLVAHMRFKNAVHSGEGDEKEKVAAAKLQFPSNGCDQCGAKKKKLLTCGACKRAHYCDSKCQTSNWAGHKKECKRTRKRHLKGDYSKDKMLVGELLSVGMRGGGVEGVLGTILSFV